MKRITAFILAALLAFAASAQVTTNPGVTGVPQPQSAVAITGGTITGVTISGSTITNNITGNASGNVVETSGTATFTDQSGGTLTFSSAPVRWRQHGTIVYFTGYVLWPVTGDTHGVYICASGLPANVAASDNNVVTFQTTSGALATVGQVGSSTKCVYGNLAAGMGALTNANISAVGVYVSGYYFTN